ncbi:MAG: phosphotransferase [Phycisphaerae bacterium]
MSSQTREKLGTEELAIVLSHYDVGVVREIREFARGSHRAAKLVLKTDRGMYLLKRRPRGQSDPARVSFAHELQEFLRERNFPLPHLILTRDGGHSLVRLSDWVYELFEFIPGEPYDQSLLTTYEAGKTLGLYHRLAVECRPQHKPPSGHYHAAAVVRRYLGELAPRLAEKTHARDHPEQAQTLCDAILNAYDRAGQAAEDLGLLSWEPQVVHSDWHPGNMLFAQGRVVAVIDYDAARIQPRVMDVANGVLQFSLVTGSRNPDTWPDYTDEPRAKRFLRGYDEINVLSVAELKCVPLLMIEALIAETVIPVWTTGAFAGLDGFRFLTMVMRKVEWLERGGAPMVADLQEA